jgi:hypothetical protein
MKMTEIKREDQSSSPSISQSPPPPPPPTIKVEAAGEDHEFKQEPEEM